MVKLFCFLMVFGLKLGIKNGGGGGNRTPVLSKLPDNVYMRVPSLEFIVLPLCRRTGGGQTIPRVFSPPDPGIKPGGQSARI